MRYECFPPYDPKEKKKDFVISTESKKASYLFDRHLSICFNTICWRDFFSIDLPWLLCWKSSDNVYVGLTFVLPLSHIHEFISDNLFFSIWLICRSASVDSYLLIMGHLFVFLSMSHIVLDWLLDIVYKIILERNIEFVCKDTNTRISLDVLAASNRNHWLKLAK